MKISITERLARKSSRVLQTARSLLVGSINIQFLGQTARFSRGSTIPYGQFTLPQHTHRNRVVRDSDFIQQLALSAYLESTETCKLFVDVGAFHGYYAVAVGTHLSKTGGKVLAIEPDPVNFEKLSQSVELNDLQQTVTCLNVACSDECGSLYFESARAQGALTTTRSPSSCEVQAKTLDAILNDLNIAEPIDCLMIDVEGAELPVLRGLAPDRRRHAKMFVEMHPYAWSSFGYGADDFDQYLRDHQLCCIDMFHRVHSRFADDPWQPNYIGPTILAEQSTLFGNSG